MGDINGRSRRVPVLCKIAPAVPDMHMEDVHIEDVHRARGIMGILGDLDRAGLIDATAGSVHAGSLAAALARWDVRRTDGPAVHAVYRAARRV